MISHHDAQVGRVLAALRETGVEENTLIVYVSDHGLALGRHGLRQTEPVRAQHPGSPPF